MKSPATSSGIQVVYRLADPLEAITRSNQRASLKTLSGGQGFAPFNFMSTRPARQTQQPNTQPVMPFHVALDPAVLHGACEYAVRG